MKLLLTGSNGFIGSYFQKNYGESHDIYMNMYMDFDCWDIVEMGDKHLNTQYDLIKEFLSKYD